MFGYKPDPKSDRITPYTEENCEFSLHPTITLVATSSTSSYFEYLSYDLSTFNANYINADDVIVNGNLVSPYDTIFRSQTFCKEEAFVEPSGTTTKYQVSLLYFLPWS